MSAISGVSSNASQADLVKEQAEQMGQLLQAITSASVGFAEKLVRLNAETQVRAAQQDTFSQVLDMYI